MTTSSDNFKKFILVSESEYKSLLSQIAALTTADASLPLTLENSEKLAQDIEARQELKERIKEEEEKEEKEEKEKEEEEEEEQEEEVEEDEKEEDERGGPEIRYSMPSTSQSENDSNLEPLISVLRAYFDKKYQDRVISLTKRLFATGHLKIHTGAGSSGPVKGLTLGNHRYSIISFIDLIAICQTLRSKPQLTDELRLFIKFLEDHDIPKNIITNPYIKKSSLNSSYPSPPKKKKIIEPVVRRGEGQKVRWFTKVDDVSDDSD